MAPRVLLLLIAVTLMVTGCSPMPGGGYEAKIVMPTAINLVDGSRVQVGGTDVGTVSGLSARDGRAVIEIELDEQIAPLHAGTTAVIAWKSALGERIVELDPGPTENPVVPSGGLIEGTVSRVELDRVLAALDKPTRKRLRSLLQWSDQTLSGEEKSLNATLREVGPTVKVLGEVLRGIGSDGPAIRALVTRLNKLTGILATRQGDVRGVVENLSGAVNASAQYNRQLRQALAELPSTLKTAEATLDSVPSAVEAAAPLLEDLAPATKSLRSVVGDLRPVLRDLRPTIDDLRTTLGATDELLRHTPGLLDTLHEVTPGVTGVLTDYQTALDFLRPYTPEIMGFFANWASAAANYDTIGHYARVWIQSGPTSANINPGIMPPGVEKDVERVPGELEGQPWTDAYGSGMQ